MAGRRGARRARKRRLPGERKSFASRTRRRRGRESESYEYKNHTFKSCRESTTSSKAQGEAGHCCVSANRFVLRLYPSLPYHKESTPRYLLLSISFAPPSPTPPVSNRQFGQPGTDSKRSKHSARQEKPSSSTPLLSPFKHSPSPRRTRSSERGLLRPSPPHPNRGRHGNHRVPSSPARYHRLNVPRTRRGRARDPAASTRGTPPAPLRGAQPLSGSSLPRTPLPGGPRYAAIPLSQHDQV